MSTGSRRAAQGARTAALAGRRIDSLNTRRVQFPLSMVPKVKTALRDLLVSEGIEILVSSAACGADLLGLEVARSAGIRCKVILPFDREHFRTTSVIDRPGDWGETFDRLIPEIAAMGDLLVLEGNRQVSAYLQANAVIVKQARLLAGKSKPFAILVWEDKPRAANDLTAHFRKLARASDLTIRTVLTT